MSNPLEAKRRVYAQMLQAVTKMGAEDLKNRYGKPPAAAPTE